MLVRSFAILALILITPSPRWCLAEDAPADKTITAETVTDEHVQKAITAIVEELYARKNPQRFWDPAVWKYAEHGEDSQAGGYTALVTLALLYAGESYQAPRLRDAIEHLEQTTLSGTYAVAIRAHIWALLPPRFKPQLEADTTWLLDGFSDRAAGWDYTQNPRTRREDNSLRQYGALGLWEAAKREIEVDDRYWRALEDAFIAAQLADGGWNYTCDAAPPRGSMTAAGLTVLFITQDLLHAEKAVDLRRRNANARLDDSLRLGMEWMEKNFSPTFNPGRDADFYYYLYGVERVGLASGYKFFGEHEWFREGAAELLRRLCKWDPEARTMTVHEKIAGDGRAGDVQTRHLAFALMFLSRGRVGVAYNKLRVPELAWNNRPRDVANLTNWLRNTTETNLNWQIVEITAAPESWLDAPVLVLASHEALPWLNGLRVEPRQFQRAWREASAKRAAGEEASLPELPPSDELHKLQRYLDLGGMLFAINEGRAPRFAASIEDLGRLLYPQYEWRALPDDHPIYALAPVEGRTPKLMGLSNGVRELIVLSPGDLSETLQANRTKEAATYQTAANVFLYSSEMNRVRPRLQTIATVRDEAQLREPFDVVRAVHKGNWNPEPLAFARFNGASDEPWRIVERAVALRAIDDLEAPLPLVVLQGTEAMELDTAEREAILAFTNAGGVLLVETTGGVGAFTESLETQLANLLGGTPQSLLRHPIITGEGVDGAADLTRAEYRAFALERFGGRENTPRLLAILRDGRPQVIFTREDVSHALLDEPSWGVSGYTTESARKLLRNLVLFLRETGARETK